MFQDVEILQPLRDCKFVCVKYLLPIRLCMGHILQNDQNLPVNLIILNAIHTQPVSLVWHR